MTAHQTDSWAALLWGRNGLRSLALAGGVAVHAINVYLVATILPSIVADIGGLEYYSWNLTLFVIASIFGSALSPRAIETLGLRNAFLGALAIFSVGTAGCALAHSMAWMLTGRSIQGLGGGFMLGLSYSAVRIVFHEKLWARAMVLISSMWGIATLIGPTIGGIFAELGHWRTAFWAVLPCVALLAVLIRTQLTAKEATRPAAPKSPAKVPIGQIAVLAASIAIVSTASLSQQWIHNALGLLFGAALTVIVVRVDARAQAKILPVGAHSQASPLAALYACVALLSVTVAIEIFIPYFLQIIHGQSPLIAGYFMASMSFGWTAGSFINAGRSSTTTERLMRLGPALSTASLLGLALLMPQMLADDWGGSGWLLLPLIGTGMGVGLTWPHVLTRIFHAAPRGQENMASAAIITLQLYSLAMGAALGGVVSNAFGFVEPGGVAGARQASIALFLSFAIGPAITAWLIHRRVRA